MMPSGPGALSVAASCRALSTSCSVIGGIATRSRYVASSMCPLSASGGEGKNVFLRTSALSAGSETICAVSGSSSTGVISGAWLFLFLAHFAILHRASGDSDALSTLLRCALLSAFLMTRPLRFLAARYASHVSSVW